MKKVLVEGAKSRRYILDEGVCENGDCEVEYGQPFRVGSPEELPEEQDELYEAANFKLSKDAESIISELVKEHGAQEVVDTSATLLSKEDIDEAIEQLADILGVEDTGSSLYDIIGEAGYEDVANKLFGCLSKDALEELTYALCHMYECEDKYVTEINEGFEGDSEVEYGQPFRPTSQEEFGEDDLEEAGSPRRMHARRASSLDGALDIAAKKFKAFKESKENNVFKPRVRMGMKGKPYREGKTRKF